MGIQKLIDKLGFHKKNSLFNANKVFIDWVLILNVFVGSLREDDFSLNALGTVTESSTFLHLLPT